MEFSKETPTRQFVIQGKTFDVIAPFAEGHACTAAEAGVLNQTLAENVRNNMASRVAKAVEDETFDQAAMQAQIDEYLEEYEFGVRRGRGPVDPIEREALVIAKDIVKDALRKGGYKLADVSTEDINRLAEETVAENPSIRTAAEKRVKEREKIGSVNLKLDLKTPPEESVEAAE